MNKIEISSGFIKSLAAGLLLALALVFYSGAAYADVTISIIAPNSSCDLSNLLAFGNDTGPTMYSDATGRLTFTIPVTAGRVYVAALSDGGRCQLNVMTTSGTGSLAVHSVSSNYPYGFALFESGPHDYTMGNGTASYYVSTFFDLADPGTVVADYTERAKYTQSYNFDDGKQPPPDSTSVWTPVGTTINLSAPNYDGYVCAGWTDGGNTFSAAGSACSTGNRTLKSDKDAPNTITWQYKKAANLSIAVSGPQYAQAVISVSTPGGNIASDYSGGAKKLTLMGDVKINAAVTIASGDDRWRLISYKINDTSTDVSETSGIREIPITLNSDSAITLTYQAERKITVDFAPPLSLTAQTAASPSLSGGARNGAGAFWVKASESVTASVANKFTDSSTGLAYACKSYIGSGSFSATGSGSVSGNVLSETETISVASSITWVCGNVFSMSMSSQGLPSSIRDNSGNYGFYADPASSVTIKFGNSDFDENSKMQMTAPNIIYDQYNTVRYALTGWIGTGSAQPATGNAVTSADTGTTSTSPFDMKQNSTITWIYRKELRVKVATKGDSNPLYVIERSVTFQADATFNGQSVAVISTSDPKCLSSDPADPADLGKVLGDMTVIGNGIQPGTHIVGIDYKHADGCWLTLSKAKMPNAGSGGWLTFYTEAEAYLFSAESAANPRECSSASDATQCSAWANQIPAAAGAVKSAVNFYPANTQINATAIYSFTEADNITKRVCTGVIKNGFSPVDWFEQILSNRKVASFTLTDPIDLKWSYDNSTQWTVGDEVTYPGDAVSDNVDATQQPSAEIITPKNVDDTAENSFLWSPTDHKYYAVREVLSVKIKWPRKDGTYTDAKTGFTVFPPVAYRQKHIANTPVNLQPPGSSYSYVSMPYPVTGTPPVNNIFKRDTAGTSVLLFARGATAKVSDWPAKLLVVETVSLDSEIIDNDNTTQDSLSKCDVGSAIDGYRSYGHLDPEGKNGYVYNEKAVYDGYGPDRAYDRETRAGNIIPVNATLSTGVTGIADPLIVVWYETTDKGLGLGWPFKPVRYTCGWPGNADTIVIASGEGKDVSGLNSAQVYNQTDPTKPGFNPNEEHALILNNKLYALRNDLNAVFGNLSDPYALLKYKDDSGWHIVPYKVVAPDQLVYNLDAGSPILPPSPIALMKQLSNNKLKPGATPDWHYSDHKGGHWAKAANWKTGDKISDGDKSTVIMNWYYPMQTGFYMGDAKAVEGDAIPFLNRGVRDSDPPCDVSYIVKWPDDIKALPVGDTLMKSKYGLPDLSQQAAAEVIFDQGMYVGAGPLVKLYDPLSERSAELASVPTGIKTQGINGLVSFPELPYYLRVRLFYDPSRSPKKLIFKGFLDESGLGEPLLLPNVMSALERDALLDLSSDQSWINAVNALYANSINPNNLKFSGSSISNPYKSGVSYNADDWANLWGLNLGLTAKDGNPMQLELMGTPMALTAGEAKGEGYVTLAFNDNKLLGDAPVVLKVIKVAGPPVRGEIKVINSDNVFDEKLTLRHSADFGGDPSKFVFEWYYMGDSTGVAPNLPAGSDKSGWMLFDRGAGHQSITITGTDPKVLADNWFMVRYYYGGIPDAKSIVVPVYSPPVSMAPSCNPSVTPCNGTSDPQDSNNWSQWAGAPGGDRAQLAEGWVKRVFGSLNLFDARVKDFHNNETNTTVSMISQIGHGYEGDIALNGSASNLNSIGLLEAYQTVFNRAESFSIDAGYNDGPANNALLNAATRIADFYTLLGNEAYADAQDPTIGFTTKSSQFGSAAPTIFAFENQMDSLLEEELALLRGRDDSATSVRMKPVYNRLVWNFTQGDGEVAYVNAYNITDQDKNGIIDENDAKIMYPQGHGDAWGYYLSAIKTYYNLLGKKNFTWVPRAEAVLVGNAPITVDYLDERKFASIAAQKAKTGTEIMDLTYRSKYVDDPAGQWQGYKDTASNGQRAWGVDEWSKRAGQGAYFDWAVANALLPEKDPNPAHSGITQIDRTTVSELKVIASEFFNIQSKSDKSNNGLNPLGLAKGVVPFDIDPSLITPSAANGGQSLTHFEQIYSRSAEAMKNAITVFDYANQYTQMLRSNQDTLENFKSNVDQQEADFKNRLIEIYGYPYPEDIGDGEGKTWPSGYDGPDFIDFMYVDVPALTGEAAKTDDVKHYSFKMDWQDDDFDRNAVLPVDQSTTVVFDVPTDEGWMSKKPGWTKRRAPGKIQNALSEVIKAHASYNTALKEFEKSLTEIEYAKRDLENVYNVKLQDITVMDETNTTVVGLESAKAALDLTKKYLDSTAQFVSGTADDIKDCMPKVTGLAMDVSFPARCAVSVTKQVTTKGLTAVGVIASGGSAAFQAAINMVESSAKKQLYINDARLAVADKIHAVEVSFNEALAKKSNLITLQAVIDQKLGEYASALAEGQRLLEQRANFRKNTAGDVQSYRYQDMSFRIFRNDALQKYKAQFDLAARYVYLAATAYDYETNLLGSEAGSGRQFFTDIVKQRSLGEVINGLPLAGRPGLADPMARLSQNFAVYKTQLGFNNPQTETNRFSLRSELFRINKYDDSTTLTGDALQDQLDSNAKWTDELMKYRVDDLWKVPEFKRYCRPFAPESAGPQPALVVPFSTEIVFGDNFFGWPLSGGDSAYDPSHFATRIRSVGVWFTNYNAAGLSFTPRVYLVPVGDDILRSPSGDGFAQRAWHVVDQKLPVPYPIGASALANPSWIPQNDSLSDQMGDIRLISSLRAYHDGGSFNAAETSSDSRLIGRSVWNTNWLLIIPGGTLLNKANVGLDTFIHSVKDIKLFFQTYSYSGN